MNPACILHYNDYRHFLKDLYDHRKTSRSGYSYRRFAEDLGFTPSNFLHLVINGKRNLSQDAVDKIKKTIGWTAQQKKYFHHLVLFQQSENAHESQQHQNELDKILGKKRVLLDDDQDAYFSKWYIPVIREILSLKGFKPDLDWICRKLKPRIDRTLVKDALQILARLKMIVKHEGRWRQSEEHLTTPAEVTSDRIHNYHKEMLSLSLKSLDLPASLRDVSAMTMTITPERFEWLKSRLVDFRDEIQQELQNDASHDQTLVAQLNIQLFPVTEG